MPFSVTLRRSLADSDCRDREGSLCKGDRVACRRKVHNVSISDGVKSYSIDEFASAMALQEIANTVEGAAELEGKSKMNRLRNV
jgi:hypothetical protein